MQIVDVTEVNFYNDPIALIVAEDNVPRVAVAQILGNLGLSIEEHDWIEGDERVPTEMIEGSLMVEIEGLTGLLYLINNEDVNPVFQEDLLKYQRECTRALRDYWVNGVAVNRREKPSDVTSQFKDARAVSRPALVKASARYAQGKGDLEPDRIFDRALKTCYELIGLEPLAEDEKLSGTEAYYLAFVEETYAKCIDHCTKWRKAPEDIDAFAREHVKQHMTDIGQNFLAMSGTVPSSLYAS